MKAKSIVKFNEPLNKEEAESTMVVLEIRGDRALVSDLRFSEWAVPPTDVYFLKDLVVVENFEEPVEKQVNNL